MAGGTTEFAERYGPWALVVGASAGIGAAVADEAARRGINVLTVARRAPLLEEGAARLRATHGVAVQTLAVDLTDPGAVDAIVAATGGLEVGTLVYNAAAEPRGYFLEVPAAEHLDNITVNCTVPTLLCHHFGRAMAARGRGAIALVSSMGALQGGKVFASYFAAKAYEWILAEGLWAELGEAGVDAVAYVVGATRTENYKGQIDGSSDADAVDARAAPDAMTVTPRPATTTSPAIGSATPPTPTRWDGTCSTCSGGGPPSSRTPTTNATPGRCCG